MLQENEKIIGHALEKYYDALERVLDDEYSKEDKSLVEFVYFDLAKAIFYEFGKEQTYKTANALLNIVTEYSTINVSDGSKLFSNDVCRSNFETTINQHEKENYIADMLVCTLYSNNINDSECYRIVKRFKEKVIGSDMQI